MKKNTITKGFTLVELIVVVSIVGILASIVFANFGGARAVARDDIRKANLKEVQLALQLYKAQNGRYPLPDASCTAGQRWYGPGPVTAGGTLTNPVNCTNYIGGLTPDFIATLPIDPKFESDNNTGIFYRSDGTNYKLMYFNSVESTVEAGDEFARCPDFGDCGGNQTNLASTYAVYSPGTAEDW